MTLTSLGLNFDSAAPAGSDAKKKEYRLRRFIPYVAHYDADTLLTEDDQLIQIIKLEGLAFQTRDEEDLKRQKRFRNRLIRSITKSDFGVTVHVVRRRHFEYPEGEFPNRFCAELDVAWRRKHEQNEQYANEIYLSIIKFPYKSGVVVGAKDRMHRLPKPQAAARQARLLAPPLRAGTARCHAPRIADVVCLRAAPARDGLQGGWLVFGCTALPPLPHQLAGRRSTGAAHADPRLPGQEPADFRDGSD